ncbi:MAG: sigma-70 family RNA polymerase sigma factor [Bacteroidota bacterium]
MEVGRRNERVSNQELLWQRFLDNDMEAFHGIYRGNYQLLYSFGLRFVSDKSSVEDCIQTMFLNVLNSRKNLSKVKSVRGYLIKSLRNQILNSKILKRDDFPLIDELEYDIKSSKIDEKVYNQLKDLIDKLSPRERELVYLKYFHSFRSTEIADLLGIEYQTVRNILSNAITKMRKLGDEVLQLLFLLIKKSR